MAAARKSSRYGHRDATMILIGYRHGLRASELCDLQWSQVELATGRLHVRRAKNGSPSVHPMQGEEIRALRRLQREQGPSSHVFMTEREGPMTPKAFHALFGRIGARARCNSRYIRNMLRHGCGYALANAGHDTRALQALARAQEHPAHGALHGAGAASVQGLLALIDRPSRHRSWPPGVGVRSDGKGAQIAPCRIGFAAQNFRPDRVLQRKIFFPLKLFFTFLIFLATGKEVLGGFHDNG
jgi:hypothetical protein